MCRFAIDYSLAGHSEGMIETLKCVFLESNALALKENPESEIVLQAHLSYATFCYEILIDSKQAIEVAQSALAAISDDKKAMLNNEGLHLINMIGDSIALWKSDNEE